MSGSTEKLVRDGCVEMEVRLVDWMNLSKFVRRVLDEFSGKDVTDRASGSFEQLDRARCALLVLSTEVETLEF